MDIDQMLTLDDARYIPWDDRYAVTRDGRVFSRAGNRKKYANEWRLKKYFFAGTRRTYRYVHLSEQEMSYGIHRLVAHVFIGKCPIGKEVLHSDGDPQNNYWTNLRYGTRKENMADFMKHRAEKLAKKPQDRGYCSDPR